jgi:hypothetical protein
MLANKHEAAATLLRSLPGGSVERHEVSLERLVQDSMQNPEDQARKTAETVALPSAVALAAARRF